jgi:hypothetical protein
MAETTSWVPPYGMIAIDRDYFVFARTTAGTRSIRNSPSRHSAGLPSTMVLPGAESSGYVSTMPPGGTSMPSPTFHTNASPSRFNA